MNAFTSRFCLGLSSARSQANNERDNNFSASQASSLIEFRVHDDPSPPRCPVGSFQHDLASGKYQKQWKSWRDFEAWLAAEQEQHALEFRLVNTYTGSCLYTRQLRYVCSRAGTGGQKEYVKLHPDWNRKRGPKRTDCKCTLIVKQYPDISTVLGNYSDVHDHDLGNANLPFTQIPKAAREQIAGLLRMKVAPEHILKMLHRGVYDHDELFTQDLDTDYIASRMEFIELRDIRRIEKEIEAEAIRLHPDDGQSTILWVQRLRDKGHLLTFKSKTDPVPTGSNLALNLFLLVIQTDWQRQIFSKYGHRLVCIDATHNVTMYENLNLTTLVVRDKWGYGVPVSWMLASNGTEETITYFLKVNRLRSPSTIPRRIISDFDWGQIHSCIAVYNAVILLCWWHVLHAWQQHFSIPAYPELWELLKNWIRITDQGEFDATWIKIKSMAPQGFIEYLNRYWMPEHVVKMWSAVFRSERSIFENCDTNMLIQAWHSVLKGKFLHGKRNRRLDHLISTLINDVLPHYALKQRRQDLGFEGPDLEVKKRQDVLRRSQVYTKSDITQVEGCDSKYLVRSKSNPSQVYEVDIETYTCTCLDYPLICFCKHICAVQRLFDEPGTPLDGVRTSPKVPSFPSLQPLAQPSNVPEGFSGPKSNALIGIAEKLERLAARLRRPRKNNNTLLALGALEEAVDEMLLVTDTSCVLPAVQHFAPVVKDNSRLAMLPGIKTKRTRAEDAAYGAGASSGSKAKKETNKKYVTCRHIILDLTPLAYFKVKNVENDIESSCSHYTIRYTTNHTAATSNLSIRVLSFCTSKLSGGTLCLSRRASSGTI
ncbi:SWIM-type domain-containing protein [Mycena venus]|uniref:SWIM-type domain-containing protein n=1 Tax=Mycena venus TaxID=2733690 RepID=A0A8H6Z462_9AGAR|nr:SWIM-type domain-containing protein [Mycena venus]